MTYVTLRSVLSLVVGAALLALTIALSRIPYAPSEGPQATLRLSWRSQDEARSGADCRTRTPEELEQLPVHMRTAEECATRRASYRLVVDVDRRRLTDRRVEAGGARGDRPAYVFLELPLEPGRHHVTIRFSPDEEDGGETLEFSGEVDLQERAAVLVTVDEDTGQLVLRTSRP